MEMIPACRKYRKETNAYLQQYLLIQQQHLAKQHQNDFRMFLIFNYSLTMNLQVPLQAPNHLARTAYNRLLLVLQFVKFVNLNGTWNAGPLFLLLAHISDVSSSCIQYNYKSVTIGSSYCIIISHHSEVHCKMCYLCFYATGCYAFSYRCIAM